MYPEITEIIQTSNKKKFSRSFCLLLLVNIILKEVHIIKIHYNKLKYIYNFSSSFLYRLHH